MVRVEFSKEHVNVKVKNSSEEEIRSVIEDNKKYYSEALEYTKELDMGDAVNAIDDIVGKFEIVDGEYVNTFSSKEFAMVLGLLLINPKHEKLGQILMVVITEVVE